MLYRILSLSLILLLPVVVSFSQNVGIGSASPVTRLDIVSGNNWDVVNGPGDIHLGANGIHLRIGMATGGGGIGATGIMQYGLNGGYNVLSLGAQGVNILQLNGNLGRAGFGTDNPGGKLEILSSGGVPQLMLNQSSTGDYARIRLKNGNTAGNTRYYDMAAFISATGPADDRLSFFSNAIGDILALAANGAYYVNGSAGSAGMVLKSNGAAAPTTWAYSPAYYTTAPDLSPYVTLLDNIPGYTYANIGQTINLPVASLVLVSASFNGDVTSCAFCGPGLNKIVLIIDGVTLSNKPYLLSAPSGGYTNVTISNYPLSLAAGTHTIQFRAEHITPSTNTNIQAIYSTVAVIPN